jgi:hypothetical protein
LISVFNFKAFSKLNEKDLLYYLPLLDLMLAIYYGFMFVFGLFPQKNSWK